MNRDLKFEQGLWARKDELINYKQPSDRQYTPMNFTKTEWDKHVAAYVAADTKRKEDDLYFTTFEMKSMLHTYKVCLGFAEDLEQTGHTCVKITNTHPIGVMWCNEEKCLENITEDVFSKETLDRLLHEGRHSFNIYDFENDGTRPKAHRTALFEFWIVPEMKKRGYELKYVQERYPNTYGFKFIPF